MTFAFDSVFMDVLLQGRHFMFMSLPLFMPLTYKNCDLFFPTIAFNPRAVPTESQ